MSTTTETEAGQLDTDFLAKSWRMLALSGAIIGLLGLLAIAFPLVTGLSLTYVLGALLIVGGIVHGVHAFSVRGWMGSMWQLALAVVSIVAGAFLLANPIVGLLSLTILVVAYLLVDGATELWMSIRMESGSGRGWIAVSGVISLVLAAFLWAGFPADAAWVVGLVVGVSLLMTGFSMLVIAITGRDAGAVAVSGSEPRRA